MVFILNEETPVDRTAPIIQIGQYGADIDVFLILDKIVARKRERLAASKAGTPERTAATTKLRDLIAATQNYAGVTGTDGKFVLTGGKVEAKELIRLEIELPDQEAVCFWSEVVEESFEIGFAVQFTSAEDDDRVRLGAYVRTQLARVG
jgi:hypothetical protein